MTGARYAIAAMLMLSTPFSSAFAHTALKSSNPASGSVLTQSPPTLVLNFIEPSRLTSLVVVTATGERRLPFGPTGSGVTFTAQKPGFVRGRNEIRWRALSRDGHVIEGSIIVVLHAPA
ncbi:copper resistance CopC family protein [Sphingomonas sp. 37zxx]|uniref:copper resistance CopC family protein n=1 Tax=Sphingomonas sp. 37zxx TaxID=1550073 RepID=UPI00053BFD75|nr:copper resistance CopC family protein [Sphingomonas sp. 37zxx]